MAVHLQDKLEILKLVAAHNVSKDKSVAAEITRPVAGGDVTFNLGIARRWEGQTGLVWLSTFTDSW